MTPRALPLVFPLLLPLLSSCATAPAAAPCVSSTTAGLVATASAITPAAPSPPAASPPPAGPALPARFDLPAIDAYLEAQVAARGYVGLSVAIVRDGAVVLEKAYGRARLAPDAPATPETPFAVGSITKQFVSSIALQLISEHKLALDDKVARWFPDLTRAKDITVHDLPQLGPQVVTYRTVRDRRWARGSQGSASPWDRLWASYPLDVLDVRAGIAAHDHEVGLLAGGDRADTIETAEVLRAVGVVATQLGALLGGAVVLERMFERRGLGTLILEAYSTRDLPVLEGAVVASGLLFVASQALGTLVHLAVDPRARARA
jgi:hypothetical protein